MTSIPPNDGMTVSLQAVAPRNVAVHAVGGLFYEGLDTETRNMIFFKDSPVSRVTYTPDFPRTVGHTCLAHACGLFAVLQTVLKFRIGVQFFSMASKANRQLDKPFP